jgi:hypothetical protein
VLGGVVVASIVGFGTWVYAMESRTTSIEQALAEVPCIATGMHDVVKTLREIGDNTAPKKKQRIDHFFSDSVTRL